MNSGSCSHLQRVEFGFFINVVVFVCFMGLGLPVGQNVIIYDVIHSIKFKFIQLKLTFEGLRCNI